MKELIRNILIEHNNEKRIKPLIEDLLNNDVFLKNLFIDKGDSFWTFVWKKEWNNRYESSPIAFNYNLKKSNIDFGEFWGDKKKYPILTVHGYVIDLLEDMFGDNFDKNIVKDWFEKKFQLPVKTLNWSEY